MSERVKTFYFFGALPAELRLEIWRLSCQPRVVEVRYHTGRDLCLTTSKPPPILQVNRESRDEGLALYKPAFRTRRRHRYIYFCPSLDALYLPRHGDMGYDDTARDFGKYILDTSGLVWSLAIDHVRTDEIRPWEPYNKFCLLQGFPNLRNAFLVVGAEQGPDGQGRGGEIEFVDPRGDPAAAVRMTDGVIESFCHEIGPFSCGFHIEDNAWFVPSIPSLVPKAKVTHGWEGAPQAIGCA